jgi:hypothetical protein
MNPRRALRTATRGLAATGLVAGVVVLAPVTTASAESVDVAVAATAWYADSPDVASTAVAPPADALPVAASAAGTSKMSVVTLHIDAVADTAQIVIRVSSTTGTSYGTPNGVQLCRVSSAWSPGGGQALAAAPAVTCDDAIPGTAGAASWSFDLRSWLQKEPASTLTAAVVPAAGATAPWQLMLAAAPEERVGAGTAAVTTDPTPAPGPSTAPADVVLPVSAGGGDVPVTTLPQQAPVPVVAQSPVVAAPAVQQQLRARPVAQVLPVNSYAWLCLPFGALLVIALFRAIVADDDPPLREVLR